jgi:AraC-like DNA-binding protein
MHTAHDHLSVRHYGASHGSHDHDHFQILIGLGGVLELEVAGRGQRITEGQGCVVPPGERHDFEARHGARCLVLDSHASDWARASKAPPSPAALALASYLARACTEQLPRARHIGPTLLLEAWLPTTTLATRPRRDIDWEALARWALSRASSSPSVSELAARVHLSAAQLAARCRAERGQSTQQWLRELRLAQARAWRDEGATVAEVARRSGYRSPSALTAARRRAGI